jgi:hypothetical protein
VVDHLIDSVADPLLHLRSTLGSDPPGGDALVNSSVSIGLEGIRHSGRVNVVRLRDIRERFARKLLAELVGADADRLGGGLKAHPHARSHESTRSPWTSWQAELLARFLERLLQALRCHIEFGSDGGEKFLVLRLSIPSGPRTRLGALGGRRRGRLLSRN